ncbi:MAG: hypothetical protein ACPGO5_00595 [Patescibacteria group bacterium]
MLSKEFFHYLNRTINSIFWALFLQGVTLVALAVLIFFFPQALVILAVVFFLWIGIMFILLALKIYAAKKRYHKYWKLME